MRIAFDHQIFGWQAYGGISRYFYELARELASACGQEVAVFAPGYVNRYLAEAPPQLEVVGIPVPRLPKSGRLYRFANSLLVSPLLARYRPDVVHETYYAATRLAPKSAKVILTVFDMIHERFKADFAAIDPNSSEKARAVRRADHLICISEQTRSDLVELLDVDPARTSVVHLGFSLPSPEAGMQALAPPRRPILLFVGNRGGYKNFEGLLRAYAAAPRLRSAFDLVCFGGGGLTARERAAMRQLNIPGTRVRQVSGGDLVLATLYRQAQALVFPSLYEGFGIPPLEAMSCGCPVVCSNVSAIPEVVGDAAEMFDPRDPEAMGHAIERVIDDGSLRASLVTRGKQRIAAFSWRRCAEESLEVYRKVLG